jgi:uncharacterized protein
MKLYKGKVKAIASDIVEKLIADGDIEVVERRAVEVKIDLEAVMENYLREESVVVSKAQALMGDGEELSFGKMKKMIADDMDFRTGEEGIDWVINQMLESFMISNNVEEVFAPDNEMRRKIIEIIRKHLDIEEQIDEEVRRKIKHIKEGTRAWEMEYTKVRREVEKRRGLS